MRLIFLECLPDPWNSTYMISYHHDLISSKRPETIPILQAWRMKPREEVGQKPGLADPHHSSSCHATLSPCTSYLLTQWKNERGHNSGSVQFSHSVMSGSLRPLESQHARPPCPSPTPGVYSNSCPSSR